MQSAAVDSGARARGVAHVGAAAGHGRGGIGDDAIADEREVDATIVGEVRERVEAAYGPWEGSA